LPGIHGTPWVGSPTSVVRAFMLPVGVVSRHRRGGGTNHPDNQSNRVNMGLELTSVAPEMTSVVG
jgi:hypothetical protein